MASINPNSVNITTAINSTKFKNHSGHLGFFTCTNTIKKHPNNQTAVIMGVIVNKLILSSAFPKKQNNK